MSFIKKKPSVIAGTTAYHDQAALEVLLQAVFKQTYPVSGMIIIDHSSSRLLAETHEKLNSSIPVIYQWNPDNPGLGNAMNIIAEKSKEMDADFIWFFDQDTIPEECALEKLLEGFLTIKSKEEKTALIVPIHKHSEISQEITSFFLGKNGLTPVRSRNNFVDYWEIDATITASMLVETDAFYQVKARNEFFLDVVDFDLCFRLKQAGYKIFQINKQVVSHRLGKPFISKTFKIFVPNYSALRWYYYTRNSLWLDLERSHSLFSKIKVMLFNIIKLKTVLKDDCFTKTFPLKLMSASFGMKDALLNKLGKTFPESINSCADLIRYSNLVSLFKAGFSVGIINIFKIISAFLINKILAISIGPSGIALLGQFQNVINFGTALSICGTGNGVITQIAAQKNNEKEEQKIFQTAIFLTLFSCIILSLVFFLFSPYLSKLLYRDTNFSFSFVCLSLGIFAIGFNTIILCFTNSRRQMNLYTKLSLLTNICNLLFLSLCVYLWNIKGAFISYALFPIIVSVLSYFLIRKQNWLSKSHLTPKLHNTQLKNLLKFSFTSLLSLAFLTITQISLRSFIAKYFSLDTAGIWQGINKTSDIYMGFAITLLALYYLPKYSSLNTNVQIKNEFTKDLILLLPLVAIFQLLLYSLRVPCIHLLFTQEFLRMAELFSWQLIGDWLRFITLFCSHVALARSYAFLTLIFDIVFCTLWLLFVKLFAHYFGFTGITQGWAAAYFIIVLLWLMVFKKFKFI